MPENPEKLKLDENNKEFYLAEELIKYTNQSMYLTGKAGTGKTTFLKHITKSSEKKHVVIAPTGVAALNAGGVTINSFFQIPFGPFVPDDRRLSSGSGKENVYTSFKYNKNKIKLIEKLELLIIDEISMVRCDTLDVIDKLLRVFRKINTPFGGVQVLLIGDTFQLPPIANESQWDILSNFYKSPYFFHSHVFINNKPIYIALKKLYRQKDNVFIRILNSVRNAEISKKDLELLNSKYNLVFNPKIKNYITLATHNTIVDKINSTKLLEKKHKIHEYEAHFEGDFNERLFPADKVLKLRKGAQIMFIKNDSEVEKRYYNGKIGIIKHLTNDEIIVNCNDSEEIKITPAVWFNIKYSYDAKENKIIEENIGVFAQFPIRLAWAITVHKSQGLTFEKMIVDLSDAFAPGQVYVALSRCTSLDGLELRTIIPQSAIKTDNNVLEFAKSETPNTIIIAELNEGKSYFYYNKSKTEFENKNYKDAVILINTSIKHKRTEKNINLYNALIKLNSADRNKKNIPSNNMENSNFKSKIESIKSLIASNYDALIQYQKLSLENKVIQDTLISQKNLTLKLFDPFFVNDEFEDKTTMENEFTLDWWNGLSEEWKELIMFNVQLMPFYHLSKESIDLGIDKKSNFKKFTSNPYLEIKHSDVEQSFLNNLVNLNSFIIFDIEEDLSPISKFKKLTYLKIISGNSHNLLLNEVDGTEYKHRVYDFYPLVNLKQLHTLIIPDNTGSNLYPISKIKTLEHLSVDEYLAKELVNLQHLKKISLIGYKEDFEILSKISSIEEINLDSTGNLNLDSFERLRKLKNLKKMSFNFITPSNDLLKNLVSIKSLLEISIYCSGNLSGNKQDEVLIKEFANNLEQNGIRVILVDSLTKMGERMIKGRRH